MKTRWNTPPLLALGAAMFATALLGCGAEPEPSEEAPEQVGVAEDEIVGGQADKWHRYVGFLEAKEWSCTASLISPRRIVTAAHCLKGAKASELKYWVTKYDATESIKSVGIRRFSTHPKYAGDVGQ